MTQTPDHDKTPPSPTARLTTIVAALRHPETGCPWDLKQDHRSMAAYIIEEAYEVLDAIDEQDHEALREELGDLAFQVVFHAQLADERGEFNIDDVLNGVADKMVERHPHVFGERQERDADSVLQNWERRKQRLGRGVLDGVPRAMPALQRAARLTSKAATVGFDWPDHAQVLEKIDEELDELKEAVASLDSDAIEDELGDALFAIVNLARHLKIDPEAALRRTNDKFTARFQHIEGALKAQGRHPADASLEEMDALWNDAKKL